MKRVRHGLATAGLLLIFPITQAEPGNWMVRVRAINIQPENKSEAVPALGVPADAITLNNKLAPEVDVTYFLNPRFALELILTYPQEHDISLLGAKIGSAKHLPPTLTLQYHFAPEAKLRPYAGVGINYTRFSGVSLNVPGVGALDLERDSWGGALQAGLDFEVAKNVFLNLDLKKIWIDTDAKIAATGAKVSRITLDPLVVGIGVGWRF
ncbi:MAG: OmpW family protein [Betaproteobacteria bacterium]|nr:OmpW family protein [Betaproteobacteria bacterium]